MLYLSTVIQVFLTAVLARCLYLRFFHPLASYPGPFLASITSLWSVITLFRKRCLLTWFRRFSSFLSGKHHLIELELHAKYGSVIRVGPNSLAFSSLSAFDAIYGFNKNFEKDNFYAFGRDSRTKSGSIFTARTDAIHREHRRKVVGPALSPTKVATYQPIVLRNVSVLLSRLAEAHRSPENVFVVNVAPYIHRYTFDTSLAIIFGESLSSQPYTDTKSAGNILVAFRGISKWAWAASLLPWFGWLMSTRPMTRLSRRPTLDVDGNLTSVAALTADTRDITLVHPEKAVESIQPSILKNYLQVPPDDSTHMSQDEIWHECFNLTFAGPGSTAAALTAVLYRLGNSSGRYWQGRIRADTSAEDGASGSTSSPVLVAVIKETLRLHAPFPTAFPRTITAGAETAIPDLPSPLPIGTRVSSNTYILGHSKEIWGDDADSWKPQRWLVAEDARKELDNRFVVFSKGPRGCIGREIAMIVIAKAVLGVLERWDLGAAKDLTGNSFLEMQYEECRIQFAERGASAAVP
ncbi:hypothetical protein MMC29_008172 [Sticta canariensis]|nr:hypothetical protein [Sticta canariensis]